MGEKKKKKNAIHTPFLHNMIFENEGLISQKVIYQNIVYVFWEISFLSQFQN